MTIKFLTFTDVHISDINPRSRLGSYRDDIINKLTQIKNLGKKLEVDFFIGGGDLFNLKAPMRNSHQLNNILIKLFKSFHAPIYTTEGNHDLRNDVYDNFDEQPLCVLYNSGALIQLRDKLIDKKGIKIRLRGFPFIENPDFSLYEKVTSTSDFNICVLHLYSSLTGGTLFKQKIYSYPEIGTLNDDIYVMGHYHIDQGIQKITDNGKDQYFINVGAISRGSLSEDNINRDPKISLVTLDITSEGIKTIKIIGVKLKVKPYQEVFNVEEKQEEKEKLKAAEEYVETLKQEISIEDKDTDKIRTEITNLNLDNLVIKKLGYYLEQADILIKGTL